jgi:prepilin-type N-terminal cleavage/methylation domain-containing protein/prepilin-type processing-associated H-X9-DG protein
MKKHNAFTLIELLVVIAIIAILAAILFPVFAQAKEAAKKTVCLSNTKEISLAVIMYTGDYDDYYPQADAGPNPATPPAQLIEWTAAVYPYIKNGTQSQSWDANVGGAGSIFSCPDFTPNYQFNQYGIHGGIAPDNQFSANGNPPTWVGSSWVGGATGHIGAVVSTTSIDSPATKMMLGEKGSNGPSQGSSAPYMIDDEWNWSTVGLNGNTNGWTTDNYALSGVAPGGDCDLTNAQAYSWDSCEDLPRYRHTLTADFAFQDGHVKSFRKGQFDYGINVYLPGISNNGGALY